MSQAGAQDNLFSAMGQAVQSQILNIAQGMDSIHIGNLLEPLVQLWKFTLDNESNLRVKFDFPSTSAGLWGTWCIKSSDTRQCVPVAVEGMN
jgi:hypothetical protein